MDDAELTIRIAEILGRIPGWEWRASGPKYNGQKVAIFYGPIDAEPDRAVGVRVYGGDDPRVDATTRLVQLRFRGDKKRRDGADVLAGPALAVLTGVERERGISSIIRQSFTDIGADGSSREQRTDNYLIVLDNQENLS